MSDWNTSVIEDFRANGGKVGGGFEGIPMLLLHHRGRTSGTERVTPLVYLPHGDDFVIFGSKAGAPAHPDWFHNLVANPDTVVEVGTETVDVRVRVAEGDERNRLFAAQKAAMPGFEEYEQKTAGIREIPVVILERRSA